MSAGAYESSGLGGAAALAAVALGLGALALLAPIAPARPAPKLAPPAMAMGGRQIQVRWYRGDQEMAWRQSVLAEFGLGEAEVSAREHATQRHGIEALIARLTAQELCEPAFWDQGPCRDGRWRFTARVPASVAATFGPQYLGRWAMVVIDAGMVEVTSFLIGSEEIDRRYVDRVRDDCGGGRLQPAAYGGRDARKEAGIG